MWNVEWEMFENICSHQKNKKRWVGIFRFWKKRFKICKIFAHTKKAIPTKKMLRPDHDLKKKYAEPGRGPLSWPHLFSLTRIFFNCEICSIQENVHWGHKIQGEEKKLCQKLAISMKRRGTKSARVVWDEEWRTVYALAETICERVMSTYALKLKAKL